MSDWNYDQRRVIAFVLFLLAVGAGGRMFRQHVPQDYVSPSGATPALAAMPAVSGPVNVNTANVEELCALNGIGPVLAERIVAWRTAHGAFTSADSLLEVKGIGPAKLNRIKPQIILE